MAQATNSLSIDGIIKRSRTNGGDYQVAIARSLIDLGSVRIVEMLLLADEVAKVVDFGDVGTAKAVYIRTPQNVGLHINNVAAPEVPCASHYFALDTAITSIAIDNDLVAGTPCTVEIWLAS